jgi:hypothetical protein
MLTIDQQGMVIHDGGSSKGMLRTQSLCGRAERDERPFHSPISAASRSVRAECVCRQVP